jgi:hypothetical protein
MLIKKYGDWKLIKEEYKDIKYQLLKSGVTSQQYLLVKTYIKIISSKIYCKIYIGEGTYCYCGHQEDYDASRKSLEKIGIKYGKSLGFSNISVDVSESKLNYLC